MANPIEQSANDIAEALSPAPVAPSARWRWGTVRAVTEYGTMNVEVGGSILVGIRAARHCMGASVGDRVRVAYYGTEAIVDAIRATEQEDTDWAYLVGSATGNFCRWRRKSGWVQVEIYYASDAGLTANVAKRQGTGTIPEGSRPDHEVNSALYLGARIDGQADLWVAKGGDVWINATVASSTVYGQLQYPI